MAKIKIETDGTWEGTTCTIGETVLPKENLAGMDFWLNEWEDNEGNIDRSVSFSYSVKETVGDGMTVRKTFRLEKKEDNAIPALAETTEAAIDDEKTKIKKRQARAAFTQKDK